MSNNDKGIVAKVITLKDGDPLGVFTVLKDGKPKIIMIEAYENGALIATSDNSELISRVLIGHFDMDYLKSMKDSFKHILINRMGRVHVEHGLKINDCNYALALELVEG